MLQVNINNIILYIITINYLFLIFLDLEKIEDMKNLIKK